MEQFGNDREWGLRELGLFAGDGQEWYTGAFLTFEYESIGSSVEDVRSSLRTALYLSVLCNRTLILPRIPCQLGAFYAQMSGAEKFCVYSSKFSFSAISKRFSVRESSFLEHPNVIELTKQGVVSVDGERAASVCRSNRNQFQSFPVLKLGGDLKRVAWRDSDFDKLVNDALAEEMHPGGCC